MPIYNPPVQTMVVNDTEAPTGPTNRTSFIDLFNQIANRIVAITGAADWNDAPAVTLAAVGAQMSTFGNIDGGDPSSVYTMAQTIDGGTP